MKYFITGATGFIGGRVAKKLREAGHQVTALVRDPAKATELAAAGVVLAPGDITDRESMRAPMTGVDGIFHIAAWYKIGMRDKSAAYKANVEGTRNVLELMKELGIKKGVYTSTLAVFSDTHGQLHDESYKFNGPFISEYDRTKWLAHYEVAEPMVTAGLPLVTVMPGIVYGPGDTSAFHDTLVMFLKGKLPMVPRGNLYSAAHVDDIAQGHILAMEKGKPGEDYIIGGPLCTLMDMLVIAHQVSGARLPIQVPAGMMRATSELARVVEIVIPLEGMYSSEGLRASAGVTYIGDNAKAKRELGYAPRTIAEGMPETIAWEMAQLRKH